MFDPSSLMLAAFCPVDTLNWGILAKLISTRKKVRPRGEKRDLDVFMDLKREAEGRVGRHG